MYEVEVQYETGDEERFAHDSLADAWARFNIIRESGNYAEISLHVLQSGYTMISVTNV